MDFAAVLAFALTTFVIDITPGPAVLKVTGDAMGNGWRPAQLGIIGILAANAIYVMAAALGLAGLFLAFPALFDVVKWAGVAYLAWIGIGEIVSAWRASETELRTRPAATPTQLFRSSFVMQIGNPKALLYYCAILPAFAALTSAPAFWIVALGFTGLFTEYAVLFIYSLLGSRLGRFATRASVKRVIDALAGMLLIGAAAMIARTSLQSR
ncbi:MULTISPECIES: LysE family translocator [Rhodomicrobium]|uniref:LysE family translocator n=1 Tax=Rhodomicrobium TaxID=1068 RepID=UPI001481EF5D|nr:MULTISPECIES: LysE family translocator [Rhodomicrobium]